MKNHDQAVEINIPDHPYRILIIVVQDQEKLMCH